MLTITGHKIDITDPLRSLIEKKFKKIEKHFTHGFTKADIVPLIVISLSIIGLIIIKFY